MQHARAIFSRHFFLCAACINRSAASGVAVLLCRQMSQLRHAFVALVLLSCGRSLWSPVPIEKMGCKR